MSHHDDNPEKMARMRDWLEIAARVISHGPSRPGAPLTAFLVGIATAQGGDTLQLVKKLMQAAEQRGQTRD